MSRLRFVVSVAVVTAAITFPLGALAAHQFSDVPSSNIYHADIDALVDSGVTTGCGGGKFCPTAFVTREQMAAFMNRLGALGPGKTPVVDAASVDGKDVVLGAGDIVTIQQGPWLRAGVSPVATTHYYDSDAVRRTDPGAGAGEVILQIDAPSSIDGVSYGLKSLSICHSDTSNVSITHTSVWQSTGSDSQTLRIDDPTDRTMSSKGCYELSDPTPNVKAGGVHVSLIFSFASQDAMVFLGNVTATWTPTTLP